MTTTNEYLQQARAGQNEAWRYVLTIVILIAVNLLVSAFMLFAGIWIEGTSDLAQFDSLTYLLVAFLPFGTIVLTLYASLVFLHGRPFSSLLTAARRFRWGNLFFSAAVWFALSALGDILLARFRPGNYVWTYDSARFWFYLLPALVLVPIQTTAEELLFRGYLTQGFGLVVARGLPLLAPALFFALLHSWNPEVAQYGLGVMMTFYVSMGLLLGWITLQSRGLELALGLHAANNLYSALIVTFAGSAIPSPALFTLRQFDALAALIVFFGMAGLYLLAIYLLRRRALWTAALALVVLLVGCVPAVPAGQDRVVNTIPLSDCQLSSPGASLQIQARCGTLEVYENRAANSGRKISLHIAVLPASSQNKEPDPLFLLAGGPGQAASEAFVPLLSGLERVRFKRDLVLVDQRGTGQSNRLSCPPEEDPDALLSKEDPPLAEQLADLDACLAQLDGDPRFYTTEIAMQDLDEVRQKMGYEQLNLLGVSYGTRAALAYLQLFPEHVRTVTLDSIAPPGWNLGDRSAADAQRAFDLMVARCQQEDGCRAAFPDVAGEFEQVLADLEQTPVEVTLDHPVTGRPATVRLTRERAAITVRLMLYNSEMVALLPLTIHQAAQGDLAPLTAQFLLVSRSMDESMSDGMYYSVVCAEDEPYYVSTPPAEDSLFDFSLEDVQALCQRWPHGQQPDILRQPVVSDVPALLLTGEADPVTPPANSQAAAQGLSNSLEVLVSGTGHNVMYRGCLPKLIADFVEAGATQEIDAACAETIHPLPFFVDFVGPQP